MKTLLSVVLFACMLVSIAPSLHAGPILFTATLSGAQQVPPTASPGTGSASILLNDAQNQITVDLSWTGLVAAPFAAHLHLGAFGVNGPLATDANGFNIEFSGVPATTTGAIPEQTFQVNDLGPQNFVTKLLAGNAYINIHTNFFEGGEIRGQLTQVTSTTPEPGTLGLGGLALACIAGMARMRRRRIS